MSAASRRHASGIADASVLRCYAGSGLPTVSFIPVIRNCGLASVPRAWIEQLEALFAHSTVLHCDGRHAGDAADLCAAIARLQAIPAASKRPRPKEEAAAETAACWS